MGVFPAAPAAGSFGSVAGTRRTALLFSALLGGGLALIAGLGGAPVVGLLVLSVIVLAILAFPLLGVAALLVISQVYVVLTPFIPAGIPVAFLLLGLTFMGALLRRVVEQRRLPFRWTAVDGCAAFLLVNGLLYVPMASTLQAGVYGYHETFRHFLLYFVVRWLAPDARAWRPLFLTLAVISFGILTYGCIQYFYGYDAVMVRYDFVEEMVGYAGVNHAGVHRAYSILTSPIQLGLLAMVGFLVAAAVLAWPGRRDAAWWLAPLLLAVAAGAALLSYTRSAWLGMVAALGLSALVVIRGRGRWALLFTPLVLGWAVVRWLPDLAERLGRYALTIVSQDPTATSFHYLALMQATSFFLSHKLGAGLGSASFSGMKHGGGIQVWSENTYLLLGVQMGFQALFGILFFTIAAGLCGYRLMRHPASAIGERRLGTAVLLGFVGFGVSGLSLPVLLDVAAMGPLWLLLAAAVQATEDRLAAQ